MKEAAFSSISLSIAEIDDRWLELLPVAACVAGRDGTILRGNQRLCDLLQVNQAELQSHNLTEFYARTVERLALIEAYETQNAIVTLKVRERFIQVQFFTRAFRASDNNLIGFLGVLVEVTPERQYQYLFDQHLPAAIYTLDANDQVLKCNEQFARLLGYQFAAEVIGKNERDFHVDANEADEIRAKIIATGALIRQMVRLKKQNGQTLSASVTAIPFFTNNRYTGRGGVIEEQTEADEILLNEAPVGFYSTEVIGEEDILIKCNRTFADIYEYDSVNEILGIDIRKSHQSLEESHRYFAALRKAALESQPVVGWKLKIQTKRGNIKTIEINSQAKLRDGKLIGRTGVIRDITEEENLRAEVSSLTNNIEAVTNDVDAVLHVFRQTLTQLSLLCQSVEAFLAKSTDRPGVPPTDEQLERAVKAPLHEMLAGVRSVAARMEAANVFPRERERLQELADILANYRDAGTSQWRDLWLEGVVEILSILERATRGSVPRDIYKQTITAAEQVGRHAAIATLQIARDAILAVDTPVAALREYITSGRRAAAPKRSVCLQDLVSDAIRNLTPFASMRRVHVKFDGTGCTNAVVRRDAVTRAIGNLLHNAIKYSWERDDDRTSVKVTLTADPVYATVAVENWGLPIPADEIELGLVFDLGFRGRLSSDRGRVGTGVGLTDSMRVAEEHDGTVKIESRPARPGSVPTDYEQPFTTVVSLQVALIPRPTKGTG